MQVAIAVLFLTASFPVGAQTVPSGYAIERTEITNATLYMTAWYDLRAMTTDPVSGDVFIATDLAILRARTGQSEVDPVITPASAYWLSNPGLDLQYFVDSNGTAGFAAVQNSSIIVAHVGSGVWNGGAYSAPPGTYLGAGIAMVGGYLRILQKDTSTNTLVAAFYDPVEMSQVAGPPTQLSSDPTPAYDLAYEPISGRFYYHRGIGADGDYSYEYTAPGSGESTAFHAFDLTKPSAYPELTNPGLAIDPAGEHAYYRKEGIVYQVDIATGESVVFSDFTALLSDLSGVEGLVFALSSAERGYSLYLMTQERALYEISGFDVPVLQRELSGAWENAGEWTGPAGPSQVVPRNGTENLTYMGAALHGGDVTLNSAAEVESLQVGGGSLEIGEGGSLVTHSEGRVSAALGETAEVRVIGEDARWEHLGEELEVGGEGVSHLVVGEGGEVFVQGVLALDDGGVLGGDGGTILGNVLNREGLLSPGASGGTLTIAGDYRQLGGGTLRFEFFGLPESELNDLFVVTGAVDLAGTMWLDFSQFAATEGMTFRFMQAGSWIDHGVAYEVSGLASGLGFTHSSLGEIQIIPEPSSYVLLFGALAFGCLTGVRRNYTLVNAGRLAGG